MTEHQLKSINDPYVQEVVREWPEERQFHPSPEAWEDQILYFFLPDRFSDGKEHGFKDVHGKVVTSGSTTNFKAEDKNNATQDGASKRAWMDAGCNFVGGNLRGATTKLGYLKRLGVTVVWIGPIFKQVKGLARSYHGYGAQDYLQVDPHFGTREDLQALVAEAHNMGMYVILDIVLNHCGDVFAYNESDLPYTGKQYKVDGWWQAPRDREQLIPFAPINERKHPNAYPDGAIWPAELQHPDCFHRKGYITDWEAMPEYVEGDFFSLKSFNLGSPDFSEFAPTKALQTLCEVYKFWVAFADLDGYRIDTVKHMGDAPTAWFVKKMRTYTQQMGKSNFLLVGEIAGDFMHETFENTGLTAALGIGPVQQALWNIPHGRTRPSDYFSHFEDCQSPGEPKTWKRDNVVTMTDDHDQIWRESPKARFCSAPNGQALIGPALAMNICTMGIPCIYYGTEQGFDGRSDLPLRENRHPEDNFIREAMFGGAFGPFGSRDRHCFSEDTVTYNLLRKLVALRTTEIALRHGGQYLCSIAPVTWRPFGLWWSGTAAMQRRAHGLVAWMRVYEDQRVLCAINTRCSESVEAWVIIEDAFLSREIAGSMRCIHPSKELEALRIERRSEGSVAVQLSLPPASFVAYKHDLDEAPSKQRRMFGLL